MKIKIRVGALVSGGGTNLQAIIDTSGRRAIDADLVFVGSDNPGAYGLERAKQHDIPTFTVDYPAVMRAFRQGVFRFPPWARIRIIDPETDQQAAAGQAGLLGVWDLASRGEKLILPPHSCVLETGGYKGRSRALPKSELRAGITERLGVPPSRIVSEYGMCELSSQAYDRRLPTAGGTHSK